MGKDLVKINGVPAVDDDRGRRAKLYLHLTQRIAVIEDRYDSLVELHKKLDGQSALEELPEPRQYKIDEETISNCRDLITTLDPREWYEEDDILNCEVLKLEIISRRLALMYRVLPPVDINEETLLAMVTYIAEIDVLTFLGLESACREFESGGQKAPNVIADVVKTVTRHSNIWNSRCWKLHHIKIVALNICSRVEELRSQVEAAKKEAPIRKAREAWESAKRKANLHRTMLVDKQNTAAELADRIMLGFQDLENFFEPAVQRAEAALIEAGGDPAEDPMAKSNVGGI